MTLELKLLADVGLVGFPNAGKSTLVASLSAAKPKIADYPFTTLEPSLGVVSVEAYQSFVIADIPGIIEGAHEGKGLGTRFLKHIERNAVLLFVIPATSEVPGDEYDTLLGELQAFNPDLLYKPRLVALSKIDLIAEDEREEKLRELREPFGPDPAERGQAVRVLPISAVAQKGLDALRRALWEEIQTARGLEEEARP